MRPSLVAFPVWLVVVVIGSVYPAVSTYCCMATALMIMVIMYGSTLSESRVKLNAELARLENLLDEEQEKNRVLQHDLIGLRKVLFARPTESSESEWVPSRSKD